MSEKLTAKVSVRFSFPAIDDDDAASEIARHLRNLAAKFDSRGLPDDEGFYIRNVSDAELGVCEVEMEAG